MSNLCSRKEPPMRLTRRGRIAATIAATFAALILAGLAADFDAQAAPEPITDSVQESVQAIRKATKPTWDCKDKFARTLYAAGFTGYTHKQAWAITWRESRHQNLIPGHPQFNGSDWGVWQINQPTWGGERWFTTSAMSDPAKQSRIAYRILTKKGTYWRPWGLTADGQLDPTHYGSWGPDLWEAWIMAPFREGLSRYPCETYPPKK